MQTFRVPGGTVADRVRLEARFPPDTPAPARPPGSSAAFSDSSSPHHLASSFLPAPRPAQVQSNHGNPLWTCLYRFRVHGKPVEAAASLHTVA